MATMSKRRIEAIVKALAKMDWRLNFYQPSSFDCSIISSRDSNTPKLLVSMRDSLSTTRPVLLAPQVDSSTPISAQEYKLFIRRYFIELVCDITLLQRLVAQYDFKIRCNYQLEAIEQSLVGPLGRYQDMVSISDGKWNRMHIFKSMLKPAGRSKPKGKC